MTIDNLIKLYGQLCDMNQCILWISPEYNDQPAVTSHLTLPTQRWRRSRLWSLYSYYQTAVLSWNVNFKTNSKLMLKMQPE